MTGTWHHGVERALGRQHAGKLALVKGSKEFSHHIEGAIGHGDILHVGHKIGRIAAFGGQAHHLFAQVEPVSVHARHRAHGAGVVALAAANIEQRHGAVRRRGTPRHPLAHQLNHRIAQRRIVTTVQKVTTAARLRLGIAHGVAALGRTQQIQIALASTVKPVSARTCSTALVIHQRLMANGTQQHGNSLARTTQRPPLSHAFPT